MGYDLLQSKLGGPLGFLNSLRSTWPQGLLCSKFLEQAQAQNWSICPLPKSPVQGLSKQTSEGEGNKDAMTGNYCLDNIFVDLDHQNVMKLYL